MDHPEGAGLQRADRVDFDPRVRLEFKGTQLSSDGGLLVMRKLDDTLGLTAIQAPKLNESGGTGLSAALKNVAAEPGRCGFVARSAQLQAFARPQTPPRAKDVCSTGRIRRS